MEICGVELSTGTLDRFRKSASRKLEEFLDVHRLSIISSCAGFFDETGMKVKGLGHWAHVAATTLFSLFILHPKRGREAHDDMGVLKLFTGILHRDDYSPYLNYPWATHSLCAAILLRDLIYAMVLNGKEDRADSAPRLLFRQQVHTCRTTDVHL